MNNLKKYNNHLLNQYYKLTNKQQLSIPLLVSSSEKYINNLDRKILYIGQETNGWLNYNDESFMPNIDYIETAYLNFLKNGANNKEFWMFIRKCLNIPKEDLFKNIIWNNSIITSKRIGIGTPDINSELRTMSIKYLKFLHNYFKPEYTIFVNGPRNPYYNITNDLLKDLNSSLIGKWPTKEEPVLFDDQKNIIWTYHPNYLNKSHLKNDTIYKIKKKLL